MAQVLAIANPTARSGKTSAAMGVSAALVELGQTVLAIDLDAQASLTRGLGIDAETITCSLFDVLVHGTSALEAMTDTDAGIDLLPAALELSGIDALLVTRAGREQLLQHALASAMDDYDWIVLDCGSSMGLLMQNALAMATKLVVPVREHSARSLAQLLDAAEELRRFVNPDLAVIGILPIGASLDVELDVPVLSAVLPPPRAASAYRALAQTLVSL